MDLVERLRSIEHADVAQKYLMLEAAVEIERLREKIAVLEVSAANCQRTHVTAGGIVNATDATSTI